MIRKLILPLTLGLTLLIGATAWAGSFSDADNQGRIEFDKGTFFGFNVIKKDGVKRIAQIQALPKLICNNGQSGQLSYLGKGSLRVHDDGTFSGTLRARNQLRGGSAGRFGKMKVSGKLLKRGKARGRIDATYDYVVMPRGGDRVHCYSGEVDWKTKRGAIVNPQPQMRTRLR